MPAPLPSPHLHAVHGHGLGGPPFAAMLEVAGGELPLLFGRCGQAPLAWQMEAALAETLAPQSWLPRPEGKLSEGSRFLWLGVLRRRVWEELVHEVVWGVACAFGFQVGVGGQPSMASTDTTIATAARRSFD